MQSDGELITKILAGETDLYVHIVRRYQNQVAATIAGMVGFEQGFEELGQEVFVRFYKALKNFRHDAQVATYLTRIAINLTANEINRKQRFRQRFAPLPETVAAPPETEAFSEEMLGHLEKLPPKQRATIVLRYVQGYSSPEAAEIVGISEGAFRTRLSRALTMLRTTITKENV